MKGGAYEIEIKSLLGNRENAARLEAQLKELDPKLKKLGPYRQLNHYFVGNGDWDAAAKVLKSEKDRAAFLDLAKRAKDFSLRTREDAGGVRLVLKAAIDDTTSANGTARREFEVKVDLPLAKLDETLLAAGFSYQSKWSRERMEYRLKDQNVNVTIDKNAGYGYLAEFETVDDDPSRAETTKAKLRNFMKGVGAEELDQRRLERMFAHYNAHWPEYYGTEKIFVVE